MSRGATTLVSAANGPSPLRLRVRGLARRASAMVRPLPDLVVIGAMKAGSTTAYALLLEHPQVRGPAQKELHFLDRYHDRGPWWYRAQFPLAPPGRRWRAAEATPYYLSFPPGPARLAAVVPEARLVVLLRDPVDRAVSQWKQRTAEGREARSLATVLAEEGDLGGHGSPLGPGFDVEAHRRRILVHGHYAEALERWFAAFGADQVLVVHADDLFEHPQMTMDRVFAFAGLEPVPVGDPSARNVGDDRTVDEPTLDALGAHYRPHNERLFALLGTRFDWRGTR